VAVAVQLDFKGGTLEQYDEAAERLGFLPGGPSARAELFHWVTKTDDGVRVVDVWETREAFEEFPDGQDRQGRPPAERLTAYAVAWGNCLPWSSRTGRDRVTKPREAKGAGTAPRSRS